MTQALLVVDVQNEFPHCDSASDRRDNLNRPSYQCVRASWRCVAHDPLQFRCPRSSVYAVIDLTRASTSESAMVPSWSTAYTAPCFVVTHELLLGSARIQFKILTRLPGALTRSFGPRRRAISHAAYRPRAESSVRERLRQPEPAEHAAVKAGHGADPIAGEGQDEEAGSVADAAGGGAKVECKFPCIVPTHVDTARQRHDGIGFVLRSRFDTIVQQGQT